MPLSNPLRKSSSLLNSSVAREPSQWKLQM
jgi:hypothetical protein